MRITGRKVVYTCISGNYDILREPTIVTPGWEYICFTDQNITSKTWKIMPLPKEIVDDKSLTQVKRQRIVKIQPWRFIGDCEVCVWADANLTICCDLDEFVCSVGTEVSLASIQHPQRKDIYEESKAIVRYKKDVMPNLQPMLDIYKEAGYPEKSGLHETNVIIRKKTADVQKVMDMWEELLRKYSHRDQMSFDYVLWKLDMKIKDILPETRNKFFKMTPHQKRKG